MKASVRWMIVRGRDKATMVGLYRDITSISKVGSYDVRDYWGDDINPHDPFPEVIASCYSYVDSLLENYDIVFLPTLGCRGLREECGGKKAGEGVELGFDSGNNLTSSNTNESYTSQLAENGCGLFYAMKTVDGTTILFAVNPKSNTTLNSTPTGSSVNVTSANNCMRAVIKSVKGDIEKFN